MLKSGVSLQLADPVFRKLKAYVTLSCFSLATYSSRSYPTHIVALH